MKRFKLISLACLLTLFGVLVSFGASNSKDENRTQLNKFNQFFSLLANYYIEDLDSPQLVESAIRSVLSELDPHSAYYTADEMASIKESFEGEFSGVGIEFNVMDDTLRVVNTIIGGPAEKVGVMANDRIVCIDTLNAIGISQSEVPKRLKGATGSRVDIDVVRAGESDLLHFSIIRDKIPINTVDAAYKLTPTSGYIKVNRFGETTMEEFYEAYNKLGEVESLVVDLRGNGGGLLSQAIEMAGFFLPKGSLVVTTEGDGTPTQTLRSTREGVFQSGKVVIMIDQSSASASEIVAGAIQDWDRGVVVGETSFGKGLVQRQFTLADESAVRITVSRYHTPSGRVIQRPYTKGQKEEYFKSGVERSGDEEVDCDAPIFKTLKLGREVYGGGGITPDIEILGDTTKLSAEYAKLIRRGVLNKYTISYLDKNRTKLVNQYPTFESYASGFEVTQQMIGSLVKMATDEGLEFEKLDLQSLKSESEVYIKSLLAQRLYSTSSFYEIMNKSDTLTFSRIEKLLENWENELKTIWYK
ncbi:MAG: S41 family peptidase [Rikenellaceae bacterium]